MKTVRRLKIVSKAHPAVMVSKTSEVPLEDELTGQKILLALIGAVVFIDKRHGQDAKRHDWYRLIDLN